MFRSMRALQNLILDKQANRLPTPNSGNTNQAPHDRLRHTDSSSLIEPEQEPIHVLPDSLLPENIFTVVVDTNVYVSLHLHCYKGDD